MDPVTTAPQPSGLRRRRLRAVMAADVANFGGHVSVDETNTLEAIWTMRRIAREQLAIHGGWLFGMPGDGIFALFESAVDAVRCALATQVHLAEARVFGGLRLRIGVHLGEVLFQDDLPFGEALIIAARLESLAEPGSVLISAAVMEAVAPRINADFTERGVVSLKHSPRRITVFAVAPGDANEATGTGNVLDWTMLHGRPSAATAIAPAVPPMPVVTAELESEPLEDESSGGPSDTPEGLAADDAEPIEEATDVLAWAGEGAAPPDLDAAPEEPDALAPADETEDTVADVGFVTTPAAPDGVAAEPDDDAPAADVEPAIDPVDLEETHREHAPHPPAAPVEIHPPVVQTVPDVAEVLPEAETSEETVEPDVPDAEALPIADADVFPIDDADVFPIADDDPTVHLPEATPLVIPDRVANPPPVGGTPLEDTEEIDLARAARLLPAACVDELAEALKVHLGPVARVLVDRNARRIVDPGALVLRLAEEIPSPAERQMFLMKARRSVRRFLG